MSEASDRWRKTLFTTGMHGGPWLKSGATNTMMMRRIILPIWHSAICNTEHLDTLTCNVTLILQVSYNWSFLDGQGSIAIVPCPLVIPWLFRWSGLTGYWQWVSGTDRSTASHMSCLLPSTVPSSENESSANGPPRECSYTPTTSSTSFSRQSQMWGTPAFSLNCFLWTFLFEPSSLSIALRASLGPFRK